MSWHWDIYLCADVEVTVCTEIGGELHRRRSGMRIIGCQITTVWKVAAIDPLLKMFRGKSN